MAKIQEFFYESARKNCKIHAVRWLPEERAPIAVVQLSHGIAEHIRRYDAFAEYLTEKGFAVVGNDHLGHGKSCASREEQGFFAEEKGWNLVVEDIYSLYRMTKKQYSGLPYALFGHSMGSFLTRTFLIQHPDALDACVICGTGQQAAALCRAGQAVTSLERLRLGPYGRSKLADALCFASYNSHIASPQTDKDWLSRDAETVRKYIHDSDCGFVPTASLLRDMLGGILYISRPSNLAKMRKDLPIFFIAGAEDPVGEYGKGVQKAYRLFQKAGCTDLKIKLYPQCRHELLNELNKEEVYEDVFRFLTDACL